MGVRFMYRKEDFDHMFSDNYLHSEYFVNTILHVQNKFKYKDVCTLEELIGLGDSWSNRACIDKLCDLGYICLAEDHKISNYKKYRNLRL